MKKPNFYLSAEEYLNAVPKHEWQTNDLPLDVASGVRRHFGNPSSFALFSSGLSPEAAAANPQKFIAGMDWIRAEDKPKPGEPELNVYHYLIGPSGKLGYPVYDCGHSGVRTPSGWATLDHMKVYFT